MWNPQIIFFFLHRLNIVKGGGGQGKATYRFARTVFLSRAQGNIVNANSSQPFWPWLSSLEVKEIFFFHVLFALKLGIPCLCSHMAS